VIQYMSVTDTQTHTQTQACRQTHDGGIYALSIASRGKNCDANKHDERRVAVYTIGAKIW